MPRSSQPLSISDYWKSFYFSFSVKVWFLFKVSSLVSPLMRCGVSWPWVHGASHICSDVGPHCWCLWPSSPCTPCQHSWYFNWKVIWVKYKAWNMTWHKKWDFDEVKGGMFNQKKKKGLETSQNRRAFSVAILIKWTIYISLVVYIFILVDNRNLLDGRNYF